MLVQEFSLFKFTLCALAGHYPNSILVNVSLILATAPAISQFCSQAFAEYVRMTDADLLFGTQIKYLKFFKPFFDYGIFTFVFLGFSVLSFLYYHYLQES